MNNGIPKRNQHLALELVRCKVVSKKYSSVRAIMAELGQSDTVLLKALKRGHGIEFDSLREDPTLFFVIDSTTLDEFRRHGVGAPTFLQLFGTARVIDTDEDRALTRWREMMKGDE